jgi:hypothetical protein
MIASFFKWPIYPGVMSGDEVLLKLMLHPISNVYSFTAEFSGWARHYISFFTPALDGSAHLFNIHLATLT